MVALFKSVSHSHIEFPLSHILLSLSLFFAKKGGGKREKSEPEIVTHKEDLENLLFLQQEFSIAHFEWGVCVNLVSRNHPFCGRTGFAFRAKLMLLCGVVAAAS